MADDQSLEISDGDKELAAMAKALAADPKTRRQFLQLLKAKNPNQPIPELDAETQMLAFAKPHIDKVAALEKGILERDLKERLADKRAGLKSKGYSDDEIAAIEKMMMEKSIPSHDTAAEYFRMERQLATPTPTSLQTGVNTLPIDRKLIKEAGGVKNWARMEAHKAADDIKAGRVRLQ